jgi:hypothetical protein
MFSFFGRKKKTVPLSDSCRVFSRTKNEMNIRVERIEHRPFYDSRWSIRVNFFDPKHLEKSICETIVRDDLQEAMELEQLVRNFGANITRENIKSLDMKDSIYYD